MPPMEIKEVRVFRPDVAVRFECLSACERWYAPFGAVSWNAHLAMDTVFLLSNVVDCG